MVGVHVTGKEKSTAADRAPGGIRSPKVEANLILVAYAAMHRLTGDKARGPYDFSDEEYGKDVVQELANLGADAELREGKVKGKKTAIYLLSPPQETGVRR
jgi:hypothetical protein